MLFRSRQAQISAVQCSTLPLIYRKTFKKLTQYRKFKHRIKGCFDNINHDWLRENIPMDKRIMKQFLKSGFIYEGNLFPTNSGSPQGGAISSIYANMTLDGLEKLIQDKYHRNTKGNIENHYRAKSKVNLIRYADDFIITQRQKK